MRPEVVKEKPVPIPKPTVKPKSILSPSTFMKEAIKFEEFT